MRVLITGATGLIGRRAAEALTAGGHEVWGVSRSAQPGGGPVRRWIAWDPAETLAPPGTFEGIEGVVNLAGEPIAEGRWTDARKRAIRSSRVEGTRHLVESMRAEATRPAVLVAGSAVGFYGNRDGELLDEASPVGSGFLAEVVQAWEAEAQKATELGTRVVQLRTGVVLARRGGALAKMLPPFKMGLGGRLASGKQWFPWIHLEDGVGLISLSLLNREITGPVNAVSPQAVTNADFTKALGEALHRPTLFPVPAFGLKLAFGEMATALLDSQRVVPRRAEQLNYRFALGGLTEALKECLSVSPA